MFPAPLVPNATVHLITNALSFHLSLLPFLCALLFPFFFFNTFKENVLVSVCV